jgi:sugar lactone lactonase YvrE
VIRNPTLLLFACAPLFAQQYQMSTIAGDASAGVILTNPTSVAVDSAGNVYFGDWSGLIRKIWPRGGVVTTVAGTGILGYSGDGGQATSARFGRSIAIALDNSGNICIADGDNNRIRRVDITTGIVTTIAGSGAPTDSGDGGPAVDAGVSRPTGITVDGAGDIYFSSGWSRVRKLSAGSGNIETVAGQFSTSFGGDGGLAVNALFWDPVPSAVNRAGDIFIADYENSRIRTIRQTTGVVTTVAGAGSCPTVPILTASVCHGGFGGDGGPATSAYLNYPQAVALDAAGNLYVADTANHRIRRVDASTGVIYTIAGTGVSGFSGDGGPALLAEIASPVAITVDSSGNVYFADEGNNRIRMLTPVRIRHSSDFRPLPRNFRVPDRAWPSDIE